MFQKMAATIDLKEAMQNSAAANGGQPVRQKEPEQSLVEKIKNGSILKEVYHREKVQISDSREANEAKFFKNLAQKRRELTKAMEIGCSKENPEDLDADESKQNDEEQGLAESKQSDEDATLSFRERLLKKNSLAKDFLNSLASNQKKAQKKADQKRHKD